MPNSLTSWDDYQEGMEIDWEFQFCEADVQTFATLSNDQNTVHMNESFAKEKGFEGAIIHGLLLSTQISRLIGEKLPDHHAVLTGFKIDFARPAYANDQLIFKSNLAMKSDSTKSLEFKCQIQRGPEILCRAKVSAVWRP